MGRWLSVRRKFISLEYLKLTGNGSSGFISKRRVQNRCVKYPRYSAAISGYRGLMGAADIVRVAIGLGAM